MMRIAPVLRRHAASLGAAAQAAVPEAAAPIAALDQALEAVMHAGKATPFAQRYATLAPVVEQTFDLETDPRDVDRAALASFSPREQQDIRAEFLQFTVASYVSNFIASVASGSRSIPTPAPSAASRSSPPTSSRPAATRRGSTT